MSEHIPVNAIKPPEQASPELIYVIAQLNRELARIWAELSKVDERLKALEP